jgi:GNAT superfamily N-acetyltransferase
MTDVVVRPASVEDADGFVRAHESAWDATIGPIVGRPLAELAQFDERLARYRAGFEAPPPDVGVWVAERDAVIEGIAVRAGAELRDLFVVPDAWGTGVARGLMEAALAAIRTDSHGEAVLWVGEANARARRFYEREGWERTDETRASPLGPLELCYRRRL